MVYALILGLFLILSLLTFKTRKRISINAYVFLLFGFMSLIAGLRGISVGEDTTAYWNIAKASRNAGVYDIIKNFPYSTWNVISYGVYGSYNEKIETIYFLLNKIAVTIFGTPQAWLMCCAIATQFLMAKFILENTDNNGDVFWGTLVYLCESSFFSQLNIMRQMLAIAIALQSVKHLKNRCFAKAIFWILFAGTIHVSSLIYIILIPLFLLSHNKKLPFFILIVSALLPSALPIFSTILPMIGMGRYSAYLQVNYWQSSIGGTVIVWILIAVLIGIMLKDKTRAPFDSILVSIMMIYISVEVTAISFTAIGRLAEYFRVFEILFFPTGLKYMSKQSQKVQFCIKSALVLLMLMSFYSYASNPARAYVNCFSN